MSLLDQFAARLPLANITSADLLVVSASGGADSMVLLALVAELVESEVVRVPVLVYHLNHRLRPEAELDLELVRRSVARLSLPFYYEQRDVAAFARRSGMGVEEAGRVLRLRGLARLLRGRPRALALTAHHANDYAESVLLHLLRGAGEQALRTLPFFSIVHEVPLLRPLMAIGSAELRQAAVAANLEFRDDVSNWDLRYARNRVRHSVLPTLLSLGLDPAALWQRFHDFPLVNDPLGFGESGPRAQASDRVSWDRRLFGRATTGLVKKLLDAACFSLGFGPIESGLVREFARSARRPHFRVALENSRLVVWSDRRGPVWLFRKDSLLLSPATMHAQAEGIQICYGGLERRYERASGLRVASFQPGMRFAVAPGKHQKLKKLFQQEGVPGPVRPFIPVLVRDSEGTVERVCLSFWEGGRDRVSADLF